MIACKNGYLLIEQANVILSISKCVAAHDHIGQGKNDAKILRDRIGVLEEQLQGILNDQRIQAQDSDVGTLYRILSRLSDLETRLDKGQLSKLPSNDVPWVFMNAVESRAGSTIDLKTTQLPRRYWVYNLWIIQYMSG